MNEQNESQGPLPAAHGSPWCPDRCPVTLRPFFCWIEHPDKGMVPTYGGPFDSYTLAEPEELPDQIERKDVCYYCERYDHDEGAWEDGCEVVGLRCVSDEFLMDLGAWPDAENTGTLATSPASDRNSENSRPGEDRQT